MPNGLRRFPQTGLFISFAFLSTAVLHAGGKTPSPGNSLWCRQRTAGQKHMPFRTHSPHQSNRHCRIITPAHEQYGLVRVASCSCPGLHLIILSGCPDSSIDVSQGGIPQGFDPVRTSQPPGNAAAVNGCFGTTHLAGITARRNRTDRPGSLQRCGAMPGGLSADFRWRLWGCPED